LIIFLNDAEFYELFIKYICLHFEYAVFYIPLGRYDAKTAINEGNGDAVVEWIYSMLENIVQAIRNAKDDQVTLIFDIQHLMYSRVTHIPCKYNSHPHF